MRQVLQFLLDRLFIAFWVDLRIWLLRYLIRGGWIQGTESRAFTDSYLPRHSDLFLYLETGLL